MVANSEKTRCPAQVLGAEGQPRAKQTAYGLFGVCNEQVPPTEVKICSELHGDMQRVVETATPASQEAGNRLQHEVFALAPTFEKEYGTFGPRSFFDKSGC